MRIPRNLFILWFVAFCSAFAGGAELNVPAEYSTIRAAIDAASDGDTVLIADGTYTGAGNCDLDFHGKAITVTGENGPENCIVNCEGSGRGFSFSSGEGETSVVDGLTITNGYAYSMGGGDDGGGISCYSSSPTISNCIITCNATEYDGGGIHCRNDASPVITGCTITGNSAGHRGGGIYSDNSSPTITGCKISGNTANDGGGVWCYRSPAKLTTCVISGNSAENNGGGIYCWHSSPIVNNCTITGNTASGNGGGIRCYESFSTDCDVSNSILWANAAGYDGPQLALERHDDPCSATLSYCDIDGGRADVYLEDDNCILNVGAGVIDFDPLFVDADNGDFHLRIGSPCVDAGDPDGDYTGQVDMDGQPRVVGSRVDTGADELDETFELTVHNGSGSGTYYPGAVVPIAADVPEGYCFGAWTGEVANIDDVNAATTTVTVLADTEITANVGRYRLVVENGTGDGVYDEGEVVTVSAELNGGWTFDGWSGDVDNVDDVSAPTTTITMLADAAVTAAMTFNGISANTWIVPSSETIAPGASGQMFFDVHIDHLDDCNGFSLWVRVTEGGTAEPSAADGPAVTSRYEDELVFDHVELDPDFVSTVEASGASLRDVGMPNEPTVSYAIIPADRDAPGPDIAGPVARFYYNYSSDARGVYELALDDEPVVEGGIRSTMSVFTYGTANEVNYVPCWIMTGDPVAGGYGNRIDVALLYFHSAEVVFADQVQLTVNNGNGSGMYEPGAVVPIDADVPEGYRFDEWTGDVANVANVNAESTTITVTTDASVTAVFVLSGDINGDDCVNVADLLTVRNSLGQAGSGIVPPESDIDGDGIVNIADLLFVRNRLGRGGGCR